MKQDIPVRKSLRRVTDASVLLLLSTMPTVRLYRFCGLKPATNIAHKKTDQVLPFDVTFVKTPGDIVTFVYALVIE